LTGERCRTVAHSFLLRAPGCAPGTRPRAFGKCAPARPESLRLDLDAHSMEPVESVALASIPASFLLQSINAALNQVDDDDDGATLLRTDTSSVENEPLPVVLATPIVDDDGNTAPVDEPSPHLCRILVELGAPNPHRINTCLEAAAAADDAFGEATELVRESAREVLRRALAAEVSLLPLADRSHFRAVSSDSTAPSDSTPPALRLAPPPPAASSLLAAGTCRTLALASPAAAAQSAALLAPAPTEAPRAPTDRNSSAPPGQHLVGTSRAAPVLSREEAAIEAAVDELLSESPPELLFHSRSAVPVRERLANRRAHLLGQGAGSLRTATRHARLWLAFCLHHELSDYGVPIDIDLFETFLNEIDAAAIARNASHPTHTGRSAKHTAAATCRWLTAHAGWPMEVASHSRVRAISPPDRSSEPSFSEMWEVAVVVHLLRIAVRYEGPGASYIRPFAAANYAVASGSLRLIDGTRSPPPEVVRIAVPSRPTLFGFHSTAALSKGRRRSQMRPLPWTISATSPDASLSDPEVLEGLQSAFAMLPPGSVSMYMGLVSSASGAAVSLPAAARGGVTWDSQAMSEARLVTGLSWLLQWSPLNLPPEEARRVARRKHGPRHVVPELGRVLLFPEPTRKELGYWKGRGGQGRISSLPNRYSRQAEAALQIVLRSHIWSTVRRVSTSFARVPLTFFAPTDGGALLAAESAATATSAHEIAEGIHQ